jgi:glycerol-3-phosphate acyltransferase PlsY
LQALQTIDTSDMDLSTASWPVLLLVTALAYLLGSVSFAVVVSKLFGLADPRTYGSGNPGATNVLRSGKKSAAALTLLGDALKGWFAVWVALRLGLPTSGVALAMIAVFAGHLFPVFLRFKGGKGVATALGVLSAFSPTLCLATLATWVIVAYFFRMSSLAAIAAAFFAPFYYLILIGVLWRFEPPIFAALVVISAALVYRHRANIARIMKGTEPLIGKSPAK